MNKKIISTLLILSMLCSGVCFAEGEAAADDGRIDNYEELYGENNIDATKDNVSEETNNELSENIKKEERKELTKTQITAKALSEKLGALKKDIDVTKKITRAELAYAVYSISGCVNASHSASETFADIKTDSEYESEISAIYDMGYMKGYKGFFSPEGNVSPTEAAAVLVRMLGLSYLAERKNGYPPGYISVASEYGLFKGIDIKKDELEVIDIAVMLKNLLETEIKDGMLSETGISGYYMTAVHDIKIRDGIVSDNGITSLDGTESVSGQIKIGGTAMLSDGDDLTSYLGKRVKAYYTDKQGEGSVILAVEESDKNEIINISGEDIEKYENRAYTYYTESGKGKTVSLKTEYNIVYNGRLVQDASKLTKEKFEPREGEVTVIDADGDGKYETLIIENYETFVVNEYNADENILYSIDNKSEKLCFDDADADISIYMCQGDIRVPITYQNIAHNGYVLSVARSFDGKAVKIFLSAENVEGVVRSLSYSDESIVINEKKYYINENANIDVSVGDNAHLYLNQYSHVIWGKRIKSDVSKLAYVEKCYLDSDDERVHVKLYSEDNIYINAPLRDSTVIDGGVYKTAASQYSALSNADVLYNLVYFKMNSENEIMWIDTENSGVGEDAGNAFNVLYRNSSDPSFDKSTLAWGQRYKSCYPIKKDGVVFVAKTPFAENSVYCYTLSEFTTKYGSNSETAVGSDLKLYNRNKDSVIGETALVKRSVLGQEANIGRNSELRCGAVVTNISKAVNDENEIGYFITAELDLKKETIFAEENAIYFGEKGTYSESVPNTYTVSEGDIIRWGKNNYDIVEAGNLLVLYDCDRDWANSSANAMTQYRYEWVWHHLWVYAKEDDWMITVNQSVSPIDKYISGELKYEKLSTYVDYTYPLNSQKTTVYVYDMQKGQLRESDLGEFLDYKTYGAECTRAVGRYRNGHRLFIVYKR